MNPPPRPLPSRKSLLRLPLAIALAAGLMTAGLSGCGEEPPPPPPPKKDPPPPPPPPPPEISISALLQESKADARVTFADSVTITDEALARAVISLADGFARGDASKLRAVLDPSAEGVLGALDSSGEWAESTSGIEAVRVVYVGNPGDAFSQGGPSDLMEIIKDPENAILFKDIPAEKLEAVIPILAEVITDQTEEQLDALNKKLVEAGLTEAQATTFSLAAIRVIKDRRAGELPTPERHYSSAVVLAVQDAKGAFLLGWGMNDQSSGKFGTAPTVPTIKPRASDFDSIGLAAFVGVKPEVAAADAPTPEGEGTEKKPDDPASGSGSDKEKEPGGPIRKNTPGGPVTIPGSG